MTKFVVVITKRPDLSDDAFRRYFLDVHLPVALRMDGLVRHVVNFAGDDPTRARPGWDAVVELYFEDRDRMEEAWRSPAGEAATADLAAFTDPELTSWSLVDEVSTPVVR
ncbi:MAG: EthD family reductase [Actinomycetota bacterium]